MRALPSESPLLLLFFILLAVATQSRSEVPLCPHNIHCLLTVGWRRLRPRILQASLWSLVTHTLLYSRKPRTSISAAQKQLASPHPSLPRLMVGCPPPSLFASLSFQLYLTGLISFTFSSPNEGCGEHQLLLFFLCNWI